MDGVPDSSEVTEFTKDGELWYITLNVLPSVDYTIALVVPKADLDEAVTQMQHSLTATVNTG